VAGPDGVAGRPLEFRLQIVVEVGPAVDESAPPDGAGDALPRDTSALPRLFQSAHSLLQELSQDLDIRMASLAWPNGVRLVAEGRARTEELGHILAVAAALGESRLPAVGGRDAVYDPATDASKERLHPS
jgi:hypothetical protein